MKNRALILIGLQNDYFAEDGILKGVVEESSKVSNIIENITALVNRLNDTLIISTPSSLKIIKSSLTQLVF